jgi:DNA-binding response OmpR family regulator
MKKVLIIDDSQDVRENIADILSLSNYKVLTADNGLVGINKVEKFKPDIIICDIMMPGLDGYEVLKSLEKNKKTANIPFIFLSAKAAKEDMRKGMNLGADDYLTKPFEEHELLDAIECRLKKNAFFKKEFSKNVVGFNEFLEEASEFIDFDSVVQYQNLEKFEKKDVIFMEGDKVAKLYFIHSGTIKTSRVSESGKELITGIYGTGDLIGQLSLFSDRTTYAETASVLENAEVYGISKEEFNKLLYENKIVSKKFISIISNDLVDVQEKLLNMAFTPVRQRVAKALIELYNKGLITDNNHSGVAIPREDFSGMIGTATETAIRMLTEFKEEGLITMGSNRRIILLRKDKLEHISNFI